MKNQTDQESSGKLIGLTRAWGAYIRMLATAVILRQVRISGMFGDSTGPG